ncbi:hypothetical protein [Streptomyces sp. BH105]|uniref:hypothetical protein n=1 Tax=Streptomyces sp. BH105 TaxID=3410408 RepID=UPI003CF241D6
MAGQTAPQRTRKSRKPTGLPNPPIILLTGPENTGKSFEAAKGSGSDLIGNTYWIEVGGNEGTADYYGRVPEADYEIVEHDGSHQDVCDAIRWVNHRPRVDGKPNLLVIDSATSLRDMHSDEVFMFARNRAAAKANNTRNRVLSHDEPVVVDPDLWNRAKDRWGEIMWLLRRHPGPVLLTARTEMVAAYENDKPTGQTTRKVMAERNLPAAVDAVVDLQAPGEAWLIGARSLHIGLQPGESRQFPEFSVDALLRRMGLEEAVPTRAMFETCPDATLQGAVPVVEQPAAAPVLSEQQAEQKIAAALKHPTDPEKALRELREEYGRRVLSQVRTESKWGVMNADALITNALEFLAKKAAEAKDDHNDTGSGDGDETGSGEESTGTDGQEETPDTSSEETPAGEPEQPQAEEPEPEQPHEEPEPPVDVPEPEQAPTEEPEQPELPIELPEPEPPIEESSPPPPDPQEEPTTPEPRAEDVSEAEQPQTLPQPRRPGPPGG